MSVSAKHKNRLSTESSPYLLQHADNPVDWYPWGDDAFELAKETSKPILLSVGYSACHWYHVMAHESFEDKEINRSRNMAVKIYAPRRLVFAIGADTEDLLGELAERRTIDGQMIIYYCSGNHCSLPIGNPDAFIEELSKTE